MVRVHGVPDQRDRQPGEDRLRVQPNRLRDGNSAGRPGAKLPEQPGHHRAVREQIVQVPEHRNPTGPGHGGEGVGLQPVRMDQIRRGPAQCRPQPPDEPDRHRGLPQRGPPKPEPGQVVDPAVVPQPGIPESGQAGRQRDHGHGRPKPLGLGPERTVGEQHHVQSRAGRCLLAPRIAASNTRSAPPTTPTGLRKVIRMGGAVSCHRYPRCLAPVSPWRSGSGPLLSHVLLSHGTPCSYR